MGAALGRLRRRSSGRRSCRCARARTRRPGAPARCGARLRRNGRIRSARIFRNLRRAGVLKIQVPHFDRGADARRTPARHVAAVRRRRFPRRGPRRRCARSGQLAPPRRSTPAPRRESPAWRRFRGRPARRSCEVAWRASASGSCSRRDAAAVVGDRDALDAAFLEPHGDLRGAGVERVFQQFLDHGRRALDHLAGGDLARSAGRAGPGSGARGWRESHLRFIGRIITRCIRVRPWCMIPRRQLKGNNGFHAISST